MCENVDPNDSYKTTSVVVAAVVVVVVVIVLLDCNQPLI